MIDVEQGLRDLAAHLDFPATPDFGLALKSALGPERGSLQRSPWRRMVLLAAAAVIVLALAALAYPPARDGVARFLHLGAVTIERRSSFRPPSPPPTPQPSLGQVVTMDQAVAAANFKPRVPTTPLGAPTIRLLYADSQPVMSLEYAPGTALPDPHRTGIGLLVTEFRGGFTPYLGKVVGPDTTVEEVPVDTVSGFWLAGTPHAIAVLGPGGVRQETLRLAENTLVWERDGVTYRIESALTKAEGLRIAASLR
jgi:hypothetical protein